MPVQVTQYLEQAVMEELRELYGEYFSERLTILFAGRLRKNAIRRHWKDIPVRLCLSELIMKKIKRTNGIAA